MNPEIGNILRIKHRKKRCQIQRETLAAEAGARTELQSLALDLFISTVDAYLQKACQHHY